MKSSEHNARPCLQCGGSVIDVRDAFTGATFPVDAVSYPGLLLEPAQDGRHNPNATRAKVYLPHLPRCKAKENGGPFAADRQVTSRTEERRLVVDGRSGGGAGEEEPAPDLGLPPEEKGGPN